MEYQQLSREHIAITITVGARFIAPTNLLTGFGDVWILFNKLVGAINLAPTVIVIPF